MKREIEIEYTKYFLRAYKKFNPHLKEEVKDAIEKFKNPDNHSKLKVHKLNGQFSDKYSFSVNYSYRIIFEYLKNNTVAVLLTVGDHGIYDNF
jgi:addiction module RelE/StbE family toxin